MRINILIILFFLVFSLNAQIENSVLSHDGNEREYIIYTPTSYDGAEPLPLLFCFHGFTSSANLIMLYSGFNGLAESENFIVVYPQGLLFAGNTHWNVGGFTLGSNVDDVGFVNALLDELIANYNIDDTRVYSTGMSNGGFMSFLLACQMSDRIAAIASVTGSMTPQTFDACDPQRIVPVLQVHGDEDSVVPYNGTFWSRSIEDVLTYWSNHNNCDEEADILNVNDSNMSDGSTVEQFTFDQGTNCSSVIHFKVDGGDHDWPGAWGNLDINASNEVWNFVSQYDKNGLIGCTTSSIEVTNYKIEVYPNPHVDFFTIESDNTSDVIFQIVNTSGQIVKEGKILNGFKKVSTGELNSGVYFLLFENEIRKLIKL